MNDFVAYITYEEYLGYGGKVDNSTFSRIERKAQRYLDIYTQDRVKYMTRVPEEVKEVLVEMIDFIVTTQSGDRLSSFSNGKVSMSFDVSKSEDDNIRDIVLNSLPTYLISRVVE